MSRKHYVTMARLLADEVEATNVSVEPTRAMTLERVARGMADAFATDNPRFDRQRFYFACALDDNGRFAPTETR